MIFKNNNYIKYIKIKNVLYFHIFILMYTYSKYRKNNTLSQIWFNKNKPVYTFGINIKNNNVNNNFYYYNNNLLIIKSDRGGGITYHSFGQFKIYYLINLFKINLFLIKYFLLNLIKIIIFLLLKINIYSYIKYNYFDIYIKYNNFEYKLCFVGFRIIKSNFLYHGISVNFSTNLFNFLNINPCNLQELNIININILNKKIKINKLNLLLVMFLYLNF